MICFYQKTQLLKGFMPEKSKKPLPTELHPAMIGTEEPDYEIMADAMYKAEGGDKTKFPYGVMAVKVKDIDEARRVAINTARNNFKRWKAAGQPGTYLEFMADRYTPPTADPVGNYNWKVNVPEIYNQLLQQRNVPVTEFPAQINYKRTVLPNYRVE